MGHLTKIETAEEYYYRWHKRLSPAQADTLENLKKACDSIEGMGPNNRINPRSVGKYCQEILNQAPAEMTIRNMTIVVEGQKEHVFRDYLHKRNAEYSGKRGKPKKGNKNSHTPSFAELASNIKDDDTRIWVTDVIQRWQHAENSCDFLAKQLEIRSKEIGGFNITAAITEGPSDENLHLPIMQPAEPATFKCSENFQSAMKAILAIPKNGEIPFVTLNDRRALVWESGSGPVMLLSPKQWEAIEKAVQENTAAKRIGRES